MEGQVSRAGPAIELRVRRIVRSKGSGFRIEAIDQQLIQTQINCNCETIVGRGLDPVRVRTFLAFTVHARSCVLNESRSLADPAIALNWKYRDAPASIVGDQYILPGLVERDIAGIGSSRSDFVQETQLTGLAVSFC